LPLASALASYSIFKQLAQTSSPGSAKRLKSPRPALAAPLRGEVEIRDCEFRVRGSLHAPNSWREPLTPPSPRKNGARETREHSSAFPRRESARVMHALALDENRGRRECRVTTSPMARLQQRKQAAVTTGRAGSAGIPCAMVLRVIRALLGDHCLVATVTRETREHLRDLSACFGAPEPHDFAVRLGHVRLTCPPRPPHPRPTYRDDRPKRPSSSRRDAREHRCDLPDEASADTCDRLARRAIFAWRVCRNCPSCSFRDVLLCKRTGLCRHIVIARRSCDEAIHLSAERWIASLRSQ
jgi:hypothetical protein